MNFAADPTVRRLGWVLVHCLWEGALVALLLAILLAALRRARATTRYAASLLALASLAALPVVNYVLVPSLHRGVMAAAMPANGSPAPSERLTAARPPPTVASSLPFAAKPHPPRTRSAAIHSFVPALDPLLPWIVAGWALGVAALSAWHAGGWFHVRRLRRARTRPMGGRWDAAIARLGQTMRIARPVRLLESALVQVPTVIGWLRPVVLVPASAVTGLTPRQLEAILAHELAHVRRHDYLVNVAQAAVETVLFYHPAVWWVSGHVRAEREHCCDDEAGRAVGDAVFYARALAAMEELRSAGACAPSPALALAADGRAGRGSLLGRIHRLVGAGASGRTVIVGPWSAAAGVALIALPLLPVLADVAGDRLQLPTPPLPADVDGPTVTQPTRRDEAAPPQTPARAAEAMRIELARLIDERIKISRDLSEAQNKLSNLEKLAAAGQDPPGLDERLKEDDEYGQYRQKLDELKQDLEASPLGTEHPKTKQRQAAMAKVQERLDDLREQEKNSLFASLKPQLSDEVAAKERTLKDVREQIDRVSAEFAKAEAKRLDAEKAFADGRMRLLLERRDALQIELDKLRRVAGDTHPRVVAVRNELDAVNHRIGAVAAANGEPAEAPAGLTVDDVARLDPATAQKLRKRDELRTELARLRTTLLPNHPAVVRAQKELQSAEQAIADAAGDFRGKWAANNPAPPADDAAEPEQPAEAPRQAPPPAAKVGERNYFISGVPRPGAYTLGRRAVNLLQALIAAGLDVDSARGRQVVLFRRQEGAEALKDGAREAVIMLTVGDLLDHREKDTFLRPDDIIMLKAAPEAGRGQPKGADAALTDPPPGLWQRAAAYLQEVGFKDLDHVTVISAYADTAAGEAFVAIRKPGEKEENSAYQLRMHFKGGAWDVERPTRYGPLSAAGIGLGQFQKEFPNARRFAEPLSVAPLRAETKTE